MILPGYISTVRSGLLNISSKLFRIRRLPTRNFQRFAEKSTNPAFGFSATTAIPNSPTTQSFKQYQASVRNPSRLTECSKLSAAEKLPLPLDPSHRAEKEETWGTPYYRRQMMPGPRAREDVFVVINRPLGSFRFDRSVFNVTAQESGRSPSLSPSMSSKERPCSSKTRLRST